MVDPGLKSGVQATSVHSGLATTDDLQLHPSSTGINFTMAQLEDAVLFKDEGEGGPVRVRRGGVVTNYEDHPRLKSPISGEPVAQWFTRRQAQQIASQEKLPFQET